jgi:raffinose/stachyose/melibiose transport system substrate-binding protein
MKRMTRSKILLVSALAAAASFSAIGAASGATQGKSSKGSHASAAAKSSCHLHVLGETRISPQDTAAWNSVFAAFKAKYGCTVTATWEGDFTDVPMELNELHLAHTTVDLVTDATENYNLASAGELLDLTKLIKPYASHFAPGTLLPFTLGTQVWSIPMEPESASVFFYNVTLFKKLGLTAPLTYAELVKDASVITKQSSVQPLVEAGNDTWEWPMWYMAAFDQTSGNKSVADTDLVLEGKQQFTSGESKEAFTDLAKFSKDGLLNETSLATSEDGANAAFLQGKAAMMMDGTWDLPTLRAAKPSFKLGVFVFPLVVNTKGVVAQSNGSPTEGLSIPSFIPKADIPMTDQFLEFMTTPAQASKIEGAQDAVVPTITGVTPASDPLSKSLTSYLPRTVGWLDWIWPTNVVTAMENSIEGVLFQGETPAAATKALQTSLDTLRSQQNYGFGFWNKWTSAQKKGVEPDSIPKVQVTN